MRANVQEHNKLKEKVITMKRNQDIKERKRTLVESRKICTTNQQTLIKERKRMHKKIALKLTG